MKLFTTDAGVSLQEKVRIAVVPPSFSAIDAMLFRAAAVHKAKRRRQCLLIVEDDPFMRRLLSATLKADYDIVEAATGAEALRAYVRHAPDAVFLDIELPDLNGTQILSALMAFDRTAFVIMLSGHGGRENILSTLKEGAQGFVSKPFAKDRLIEYLRLSRKAKPHGALAASLMQTEPRAIHES